MMRFVFPVLLALICAPWHVAHACMHSWDKSCKIGNLFFMMVTNQANMRLGLLKRASWMLAGAFEMEYDSETNTVPAPAHLLVAVLQRPECIGTTFSMSSEV